MSYQSYQESEKNSLANDMDRILEELDILGYAIVERILPEQDVAELVVQTLPGEGLAAPEPGQDGESLVELLGAHAGIRCFIPSLASICGSGNAARDPPPPTPWRPRAVNVSTFPSG